MTRRVVAVLLAASVRGVPRAVPGFLPGSVPSSLPDALRLAMLEDVYETVAQLELVEAVVVVAADDPMAGRVGDVTWPGTHVLTLPPPPPVPPPPAQPTPAHPTPAQPTQPTPPTQPSAPLARRAVTALAEHIGAGQVTVVAADAPDLPGLLVGKLHRALGSADVAVLPAADGGLVAVATHVPLPTWLAEDVPDLDGQDPVAALRVGAPRRTSVSVGPGWHRVRRLDDVRRLDPGLEGWEVTRAELGR